MNNPFDRTIIRPLEKPLADDINQAETNFDQALRFFAGALFSSSDTGDALDGFLGSGLLVAAASLPDMSVSVAAGLGFQTQISTEFAIDGVPGLNDLDTYKPIPLLANQGFTVPTAPVGPSTRVDIIEVKADRIVTDPTSRQVFNEGLGQFVPGNVNKTLAWALDGRAATVNAPSPSTAPLSYVVGQAGNPGLPPPTSPGYIKLAEIAVGSDVVAIVPAAIADYRASLTSRVSKIHWPASDGVVKVGTGTPDFGGGVLILSGGVWLSNIGAGLEAGDIIEDVVTVWQKTSAVSNNLQSRLQIKEVDLDAPSVNDITVGYADTGAQTLLGIYTVSHAAAFPAFFPYVWQAGSTATMQHDSDLADDTVLSTFAVVRRSSIKRDL